jgi:C_GCAxxG_C_C family probable redox protein
VKRRIVMEKKDDAKLVAEKAKGYFDQGFNCAEAIAMSFKDYLGHQGSLLPGLATGFGAGIGQKGSVCGAYTGGVMALGMKFGRTDPKDKETQSKVYEKSRQFWSRFEKEFGNIDCLTLVGGVHLDNPEEAKKWVEAGGRKKCSDNIVEKTAKMLFEFI